MKLKLITLAAALVVAGCSSNQPLAPGNQAVYNKGPMTKQIGEFIEYDYYSGVTDRIKNTFSDKRIVEIRVRAVAPIQSGSPNNIANAKEAAKVKAFSIISDFLCSTTVNSTRSSKNTSRYSETGTDRKSNKISSNNGESRSETGNETNIADRRDVLTALSEDQHQTQTRNQCTISNPQWKEGDKNEHVVTMYMIWNRDAAVAADEVSNLMARKK